MKWTSIEYAQALSTDFGYFAATEPRFEPELETSKAILELMRVRPQSEAILVRIETMIREIDDRDHYNGSGWHGFKGCVADWVRERRNEL